jgi:hypothetical protein
MPDFAKKYYLVNFFLNYFITDVNTFLCRSSGHVANPVNVAMPLGLPTKRITRDGFRLHSNLYMLIRCQELTLENTDADMAFVLK